MTKTNFYRMKQEIKLLLVVSLWLAVTVLADLPTVLIVRPLSSYPVAVTNRPADFFFFAKHTGGTNYGLQQISSTNLYYRDNQFMGDTAPGNGWLFNSTGGGGSMKLTGGGVDFYPGPTPPQFAVSILPFVFTRYDADTPTVYFGLAELGWSDDLRCYVAGSGYGLVAGGLGGNFTVGRYGTNWFVHYTSDGGPGGYIGGGILLLDIANPLRPYGAHYFAFQIPPETGSWANVVGYVNFDEVTNPPPAGFNGTRFFQKSFDGGAPTYLHLDNSGNQTWNAIP